MNLDVPSSFEQHSLSPSDFGARWPLQIFQTSEELNWRGIPAISQIHMLQGPVITFRLNRQLIYVLVVIVQGTRNIPLCFSTWLQKRIKRDCTFLCFFPETNWFMVVFLLPNSSYRSIIQIGEAIFFSSYFNSAKHIHYVSLWSSWKWSRH